MSDYYKPEIRVEKPLKPSAGGYRGDLPENSEGGFIKTGIEHDVIVQRISKDLYAKPSSGIRELYANEARACREARRLGADPTILLTVNLTTSEVTLEGVDSMGIDWDTFANVCCVLGRSSNFDSSESGQFGMGMYAYTCISDIMLIETHARKTGEKYTVMGKSGLGFDTGFKEPDMDHFGTRIRLTARKDVPMMEIVQMARDCARMSTIRTVIRIQGRAGYDRHLAERLVEMEGEVEQTTLSKLAGEPDAAENGSILSKAPNVVLSDDDIEAAMAITPRRGGDGEYSFLCGIPIRYEYNGKYRALRWNIAVNIKNERKYQPTPDRERMKDDSTVSVDKKIDAMIEERVSKLCSKRGPTIRDYVSNPDMRILDVFWRWQSRQDVQAVRIPKKYGVLASLMNVNATEVKATAEEGEPLHRMISGPDFLVSKSIRTGLIEAVKEHDPKMDVVRVFDFEDHEDAFRSLGIQTLEEYARLHNIKARPPAVKNVTAYELSYRARGTPHTFKSNDIPPSVVIAEREDYERLFATYRGLDYTARRYFDAYLFTTTSRLGREYSGGTPFEKWFESVGNHVYDTSMGVMTLRQIFSTNKIPKTTGAPMKSIRQHGVRVEDNNTLLIHTPREYSIGPLFTYMKFADRSRFKWMAEGPASTHGKGTDDITLKVRNLVVDSNLRTAMNMGYCRRDDRVTEGIVDFVSFENPEFTHLFHDLKGHIYHGYRDDLLEALRKADREIAERLKGTGGILTPWQGTS